MKKDKSIVSRVLSWIFIILMLYFIIRLFWIFRENYFNDFTKAEMKLGTSEFKRDVNVKYSNANSYRIESEIFNNAAFYKEVEVKPNTAYRVTCMVKTEDVVPDKINSDGGAHIAIIEEAEVSKSIRGTTDWQKIEMYFNSKNRTSVKIGFRLGGNTGSAKGKAWFSDFKLEQGTVSEDSTWNVACFILKNIDVTISGQEYNFSVTTSDVETIRSNMKRFQESCKTLSDGKMNVKYDLYEINDTLKTISYSDEHGYYVDPYDINEEIENIIIDKEYDYVFMTLRMGNTAKEIPVNNWVGLRKYGFIWSWLFKYQNVK